MRGKVPFVRMAAFHLGITPAYAGKRPWSSSGRTTRRDHPRVCGEKLPVGFFSWSISGSPPRMRGKVLVLVVEDLHSGITPAYAGKRSFLDLHPNPVWDHPRVCGEKVWRDVKRAAKAGSPPRMRGKDPLQIPVDDATGITPAYAGKSHTPAP